MINDTIRIRLSLGLIVVAIVHAILLGIVLTTLNNEPSQSKSEQRWTVPDYRPAPPSVGTIEKLEQPQSVNLQTQGEIKQQIRNCPPNCVPQRVYPAPVVVQPTIVQPTVVTPTVTSSTTAPMTKAMAPDTMAMKPKLVDLPKGGAGCTVRVNTRRQSRPWRGRGVCAVRRAGAWRLPAPAAGLGPRVAGRHWYRRKSPVVSTPGRQ